MQCWEIYWVQEAQKKQSLVEACLNQSAAKTAQQLLVFVATTKNWKRNSQAIAQNLKNLNSPQAVLNYYEKLIPSLYGYKILAPLKWLMMNIGGLFKAMPRHPWSSRDLQEVAVKSMALACENFMLAVKAQGFDTCPMEGFDEARVKKLLSLKCQDKVTMVISVGKASEKGIWGEQFRLPKDWFVFKV
jgi:nitroreductase